jgi:hypothetical protein
LRDTFGEHCALALLVGHPIQRYAGSIAFSKEIGRHWTRDHLRELWAPEPFDSLFGSITDILRPDDDHVRALRAPLRANAFGRGAKRCIPGPSKRTDE